MSKKYTIREVADLIGISTDAIRLYEKEGLVSPLRDPGNGYRYYGPDEIQHIMGIHLYRQLDVSIPEIRNIYSVSSLTDISNHFTSFINQTEQEIHKLQNKLEKLVFMKEHLETIQKGHGTCSIQELPNLYMLFQQDFSKTLYENMKDVLTSPIFSFGNFCYTLRTNETGTYSPHALEFAIREPMMKVCPLHEMTSSIKKIPACSCIYTVITAPDLNGVEWDLSRIYRFAKEHNLAYSSEGYAFYVYSLIKEDMITDYYEIYLPIIK